MPAAPIPPEESERLRALKQYQILDTPPEADFEDIIAYAVQQFNVPIAFIGLIDEQREWFKACYGLDVNEASRDITFCAYTILQTGPLIVNDTRLDTRFADNPAVTGEPSIRFYVGIPLLTPKGYAIGTLCLADYEPRYLLPEEILLLQQLAQDVMIGFKKRLANRAF